MNIKIMRINVNIIKNIIRNLISEIRISIF